MLSQAIYSIGTAAQTVVAPTNDYVTYILKNLEPESVTVVPVLLLEHEDSSFMSTDVRKVIDCFFFRPCHSCSFQ